MITSTRTDMADNTTFHAHCEVAFYAVTFCESGVMSTVQEHQTMPVLRGDYWFTAPDGTRANGSITDRGN